MGIVEIFKYESEEETQFNELRTIEKEDGNILFCASDVAKILWYENPAEAVANHFKSGNIEKCYVAHSNGSGGVNMKFIPEGDVYRLIIRSKLPSAERFESWLFDEVIPYFLALIFRIFVLYIGYFVYLCIDFFHKVRI